MKLTGLLVGTHFHPPAKLVLSVLPAGAALRLQPEPDNPWDEDAIQVFCAPTAVAASQRTFLAEQLPLFGTTIEEFDAGGEVLMGHVAASGGKPLAKARATTPELVGTLEFGSQVAQGNCVAQLAFDAAGQALIVLALPAAALDVVADIGKEPAK